MGDFFKALEKFTIYKTVIHAPIFFVACMLLVAINGFASEGIDSKESKWVYFVQSSDFRPSGPPPSRAVPVNEGWYVHSSGIVQNHKTTTGGAVTGHKIHEVEEFTNKKLALRVFEYLENAIGNARFGFEDRGELTVYKGISASYVPAYTYVVADMGKGAFVLYGGLTDEEPQPLRKLHDILKEPFVNAEDYPSEATVVDDWLQAMLHVDPQESIVNRTVDWFAGLLNRKGSAERTPKRINSPSKSPEVSAALRFPFRMVALHDVESAARVLSGKKNVERWLKFTHWKVEVLFKDQNYYFYRYETLKEIN